MSAIRSGCAQMRFDNCVHKFVTGAFLVATVALDYVRHRVRP